jgi:hypothetical protein
MEWGGARVVDWGRLLSGCRGIKPRPQVRILSSPLGRAPAVSSGRYLINPLVHVVKSSPIRFYRIGIQTPEIALSYATT